MAKEARSKMTGDRQRDSKLKFPSKRRELISLLTEMSDVVVQQSLWINHNDKNANGIDEVIHFFFDDTDLADSPENEVGYIVNENELRILKDIIVKISSLISKIGDKESYYYMQDIEWRDVVDLSRKALDKIKENDDK